jgi:glycosyltransferase involved in cell wall biosynthesis
MGKAGIKVTYLVDFFRTMNAGTEKQLGYLLTHFPKAGYSVQLVSLQNSDFLQKEAPSLFPGVRISTLCASSDVSTSLGSLAALFSQLRRTNPDILHTVFPTSNSLGVLIGRMAGVRKIVSSRRDMGFNLNERDLRFLRLANTCVSCIVANSEAVRMFTISQERVDQKKTTVIYNGIPAESFGIKSSSRKGTRMIVGIIANLNRPVKRVDLFIRAAALVSRRYQDVEFWIIGDGDLRIELENMAREVGVFPQTLFLGRRTDVQSLLHEMTIGVICSDSEGLSNALMEYMATGLPLVATDIGGNPELVQNGRTGFLVEPNNAEQLAGGILRLVEDRDLAKKMGKAGREALGKKFSVKKMLDETREMYESLER